MGILSTGDDGTAAGAVPEAEALPEPEPASAKKRKAPPPPAGFTDSDDDNQDDVGHDDDASPAAEAAAALAASPAPQPADAVDSQQAMAWARALRQATGGYDEEASGLADDARPPPAKQRTAAPPAKRRVAPALRDGPATARKSDVAAPAPAVSAGVLRALERTRLGEGRGGVYFADAAFNWRDLAVNAAAQTWSLLGGAADADTPAVVQEPARSEACAEHTSDAPPAAAAAPVAAPPAAAPPRAAALALLPRSATVDLHALGAGFVRSAAGGDGAARGAWEANREALLDDFKRKRRQARRAGAVKRR